MPERASAEQFLQQLDEYRRPNEQEPSGRALEADAEQGSRAIPMRQIFALAKQFMAMPPGDIETLLDSPRHDVRVGAVSIMDWQARSKKLPEQRRKALFDLYIRRHDRINTWDLVDRCAPYVVGGYLANKPRAILYELARSESPMERRTAIVATYYFIRQGDVDDTFAIAEVLVYDPHDLVQKAVGGWVREAGKRNPEKLLSFLDTYAPTMPRTILRYAIEHLDPAQREHYLGLKGTSAQSER
ncbi:MAG: DNA alkylation repair protein [Chloroflexota bacterium]|nr:DNA alkylation repair protein [Chloroflexota bacterium]